MQEMRKRIAGVFLLLLIGAVISSLVFANAASRVSKGEASFGEPSFTASLQFDAAMDNHVKLLLTNDGVREMKIARQARYMDQLGTAGSWGCSALEEQSVKPGQTVCMEFFISEIAAHGNRSILAFFFEYNDCWYLGKVGEDNGTEYFQQHN